MPPEPPDMTAHDLTPARPEEHDTRTQDMHAAMLRDTVEAAKEAQAVDTEPRDGDEDSETDGNTEEFVDCQSDFPKEARNVIRLFQCRICSLPYRDAVTLPCGRTICKSCLPQTHARPSITYPALPDRQQGFQCPFDDCRREHAIGDCSIDVILNKIAANMAEEMARRKAEASSLQISTEVQMVDPWGVAGVSTLRDEESSPRVFDGGKLVATWTLAEEGDLTPDVEVSYRDVSVSSSSSSSSSSVERDPDFDADSLELGILQSIQQVARNEVDCQVCYALFFEPLTTGCGHTFCRACLHRILDHSRYCPICRRKLGINPLLDRASCRSNQAITDIIEMFWSDELVARQAAYELEMAASRQALDTPLFVCTLAFPHMPTFLHIFEPRYRLMIRRAMEGDRTFGIVMPKMPLHREDAFFHELGTLLRIVNVQYYPDGRSLIETIGLSRFKVLQHGSLDGYTVCKTERIDDISLEEEEAMEAAEVTLQQPPGASDSSSSSSSSSSRSHAEKAEGGGGPQPDDDILADIKGPSNTVDIDDDDVYFRAIDTEHMSTQDLMQYSRSFITRMHEQSVPWLTERIMRIYGECPDDPATFPWWFASILPVKDLEKYQLLSTSSVRQRLKMCCRWIVEWETTRWSLHGCNIG